MRKIVAGLHMSLDGVVEAPERWYLPYFNDEMGRLVGAQLAAADTLLLGRKTYQTFASFWPARVGSGDPMAERMNTISKLVASTTLDTVGWENSSLIKGDVAEELTQLKQGPGNNLQITGSLTLVGSLLAAGLLDELSLLVLPIVIGPGKRLLPDITERTPLTLTDSQTFSTGVLALSYRPSA